MRNALKKQKSNINISHVQDLFQIFLNKFEIAGFLLFFSLFSIFFLLLCNPPFEVRFFFFFFFLNRGSLNTNLSSLNINRFPLKI